MKDAGVSLFVSGFSAHLNMIANAAEGSFSFIDLPPLCFVMCDCYNSLSLFVCYLAAVLLLLLLVTVGHGD